MASSRMVKILKPAEQSALDAALAVSERSPQRIDGVLIGTFVGLDHDACALIDLPDPRFPRSVAARATIPLEPTLIGREVAVVFEGGHPQKPLIIGLIQPPSHAQVVPDSCEVQIDGERVTLMAREEIVLQCGKASITLTRTGKVVIRGEYLLSRSTGANCIKGGSIHLN